MDKTLGYLNKYMIKISPLRIVKFALMVESKDGSSFYVLRGVLKTSLKKLRRLDDILQMEDILSFI